MAVTGPQYDLLPKIIYIKAAFLLYSIVVRSDGKKYVGAAGGLMISRSLKPIFFKLFSAYDR